MRRYYTRNKRSGILQCLYSRWMLTYITIMALQLATGIRMSHAENAQTGSGVLMLHHAHGHEQAIQLDAQMELSVRGLLAEVSLKQTFRNNSTHWLEGSYQFPLPEQSAVRGLTITTGNRTITGQIKTKAAAKHSYDTAIEAGQVAGLIEQQRPNLFTMSVASIAPDDLIIVELDVLIPVDFRDDRFVLKLPTTMTPRYSNAKVTDASALQSTFSDASLIKGPRMNLNARIAPLDNHAEVRSSTHVLESEIDSVTITNTPMDRDIELEWPAPDAADTSHHIFLSKHNGQRYVQVLINPPDTTASSSRPVRELILIVDKSGSMAGISMNAAKQALNYAVDELADTDYINIIAFDDQYYPLFATARPATADTRRRAHNFIRQMNADGGTEMEPALNFALRAEASDDRLRQVVFLTDGSVAYEDVLLQQIQRHLGNNRLFTIGIGSAPNTWFLEKAAQAGRGIALSIHNSQDAALAISTLLTHLIHPVITDITLQATQGYAETYPAPIPDLYAKQPNMLVSRIGDTVDELILTGTRRGERWRKTLTLPVADSDQPDPATDHLSDADGIDAAQVIDDATPASRTMAPAVAMHWARQKIDSLMDEQRFSRDTQRHKHAITQLALDVGLVSRYTSFVAVEETPTVPSTVKPRKVPIGNLIPAGNQMLNIDLPRGSAGMDTLAMLSVLLGLSGAGLVLLAGRSSVS